MRRILPQFLNECFVSFELYSPQRKLGLQPCAADAGASAKVVKDRTVLLLSIRGTEAEPPFTALET